MKFFTLVATVKYSDLDKVPVADPEGPVGAFTLLIVTGVVAPLLSWIVHVVAVFKKEGEELFLLFTTTYPGTSLYVSVKFLTPDAANSASVAFKVAAETTPENMKIEKTNPIINKSILAFAFVNTHSPHNISKWLITII
jgi:hypothetical protein